MKLVISALAGLSVGWFTLATDQCHADDISWALGRWIGYIQNWRADKSDRDIGARVLTVSLDAPDAPPTVTWFAPATSPNSVEATIAANRLSFGHDGATISLHSDGSASLSGTYVGPAGKQFALTLTHPKTITEHDGRWAGLATSDEPRCFPGHFHLSINNGQLSGTVHYIPPHPLEGGGKVKRVSDISGEVWPDGIVFVRLMKREGRGRNSWFHAQIDGNQMTANDASYSDADCSFQVTLDKNPS